MKKIVKITSTLIFIIFISILSINQTQVISAYDVTTVTDQPIIRYVKDVYGDKICFNVDVKTATTSTRYRTIGWTININGFKIIYKYPDLNNSDVVFYMKDIDNEFKRQYGENSSTYNSINKAMYKTGGDITFDAIHTIIKNNIYQGSINNDPIYGKSNLRNYTGRVYTTLSEIQTAESWNSIVKNVDLPKYYGVTYKFSKQPSANNEYQDLYISNISSLEYREKTKVLTIVTVGNIGTIDCGPDNTVNIKFTAGGKIYTRAIDIGEGKEIIVPFIWTTPASGKVTLEAEINYDKKHIENNYANNKLTRTADIKPYKVDLIGDSPKVSIISAPKVEEENYIEWKEWRFVKWGTNGKCIYEQKTFWIKLRVNAKPNVSKLKSGYGFFMDTTTTIITNYDRLEFIIPPQRTQVFVPEKQFKSFYELDIISGKDEFETGWQNPVNLYSVFGYRKHYVPIWFPDKIYYEMNVVTIDCYCPGGALNAVSKPRIYIEGNMYEDDINGGFK